LPPPHGGGDVGFSWWPMAAAFFITVHYHKKEIAKKAKRNPNVCSEGDDGRRTKLCGNATIKTLSGVAT